MSVRRLNFVECCQVSWLEMFKMIEQQHRTELQSQYLEHQKILQEMQKNMEKELMKQQDTLKQRLSTHREVSNLKKSYSCVGMMSFIVSLLSGLPAVINFLEHNSNVLTYYVLKM